MSRDGLVVSLAALHPSRSALGLLVHDWQSSLPGSGARSQSLQVVAVHDQHRTEGPMKDASYCLLSIQGFRCAYILIHNPASLERRLPIASARALATARRPSNLASLRAPVAGDFSRSRPATAVESLSKLREGRMNSLEKTSLSSFLTPQPNRTQPWGSFLVRVL